MPGTPLELRWGGGLSRKRAGDRGERLALEYLVSKNHRTRHGEIDLILYDATTLVFVEVKLRRGLAYGDPLEAVTLRKQEAIRSLAEGYIAEEEPEFEEVRFDVVGILEGAESPRVTHVKDAF